MPIPIELIQDIQNIDPIPDRSIFID